MPSMYETAYPRLKTSVMARDLAEIYTPTSEEYALASTVARGFNSRWYFLVLLKTFQRLGYFVQLRDVPLPIIHHVASCLGGIVQQENLAAFDASGTRRRHVQAIREHLNVKPYGREAHQRLSMAMRQVALTKEDLADIINVGIEELIRERYELPGFTTLLKEAQRERAEVNRALYRRVTEALGEKGQQLLDQILTVAEATHRAPWDAIKEDPGRPTWTHLAERIDALGWLRTYNVGAEALASIPSVKVQHFAVEARSLDAARMQEMQPHKRYTLAAALLKVRVARTLDDLGEMFVKQMRKIHRKGQAALDEYHRNRQGRTDELIALLHDLVTVMQQERIPEDQVATLREVLGDRSEEILEDCKAHAAYINNNYNSLLWRFYRSHRQTLFKLLDQICLSSTSQDTAVEAALDFLDQHKTWRRDWLDLDPGSTLDLRWIPDKWWKLVTGSTHRHSVPTRINRRHFEACLFSQIMAELKSGDLCIQGSEQFADYREQLISWEEYERVIPDYGEQVGLPVDPTAFVSHLQNHLEQTAADTDACFPDNDSVQIEKGEPVLRRLDKKTMPEKLRMLERLIPERMEPVHLLDVLADTENWLHWTRFFGPLSGQTAKIDASRPRYVATTFCYGCNLGPTQTARSLQDFDRRQLAWVNQRHVTEEKLEEAITAIINAYNHFTLPKLWGSGKRVSADGTKWDLYEQNLLSEYHIRYGGYGGIGYYHVSDTYVALFSHFIPCGVWEAVYILDGLLKNKSDIQPDTVHADTQGQSAPVFGLAYLLGIDLMPRIRHWKDLKLFRPSQNAHYPHIDELFSDVIDWQLIQTHLPDMLRVCLSIQAGRILASTLLRKLGNYSRKNRLYQAFRELGRVVRTVFLLRYLSDVELRRTIQTATNKSEAFNQFVQWLLFGNEGMIAENDRTKQRKLIKYNHLVANCLIFHNVHAQTRILYQLAQEGHDFDAETLSHLSPYITSHVNRFGTYTLNLDRKVPAPDYSLSPIPVFP